MAASSSTKIPLPTSSEVDMDTKKRFLAFKAPKLNKNVRIKMLESIINRGYKDNLKEISGGTKIILNSLPDDLIDELYNILCSNQ